LPSEAEWEYACRAGTTTKYWGGDKNEDLMRAGWFGGNSGGRTHAAGELKANPFGVSDIHGNVWEWVQDGWDATFYGQFSENPAINPNSPFSAGSERVIRGGCWHNSASYCRSPNRYASVPTARYQYTGFRLSVVVGAVKAAMAERIPPVKSSNTSQAGWNGWPADAPKPPIAPFDAAQATKHQDEWAAYLKVPVEFTNTIGMKLRLIPPGEFLMGSPAGEERRRDDETQVSVTLTRAFQLSRTEVTQGQWRAVMGTEPWKGQFDVQEGDDYAATYVSWDEAVSFCEKLSAKEGKGYRLPTEAEWEWACRSGSRTAYSFGGSEGDLGRYAWFRGNTHDIGEKYAHRVGQKLPNGFGLSDMHGNVWEWCGDWHGEKLVGGSNPVGASSGSIRSHRGGSWYDTAGPCRSAYRSWFDPSFRHGNLGFRLALSPSGN
jgi:formylglycine-generating enzyme required for sulfatase activity